MKKKSLKNEPALWGRRIIKNTIWPWLAKVLMEITWGDSLDRGDKVEEAVGGADPVRGSGGAFGLGQKML
ncbi:MAG: hypothetical protein OEW45_10650 [Deltaproteobacteria bacterium]|nr:hypothetical protein [Deltaproteobacteria bacterium]